MKTQRWFYNLAGLGLLLLILTFSGSVYAQDYAFEVPLLQFQVFLQPDASARLVYDVTFTNRGAPIDIVDIGLPHSGYSIRNMSASIDGHPLTDIRKSTYIDIGVEVHLKDREIPRGSTGTLRFEATLPDMVYQDTTDQEYASFQIVSTWWDSQFVRGNTRVQIAVHMPEGVHPDTVLYHDVPFVQKVLYEGRAVAIWEWPDGVATRPYRVGVSFPKEAMDRVVTLTIFELTEMWLEDNPTVHFTLGALGVILFSVLFLRFTGATGWTLYVIIVCGMIAVFVIWPLWVLPMPFIFTPLLFLNEKNLRGKRGKYLPPIATTEGGGIKRGLTAPEAAVLLEMPLNKVLTLVLFGLLEKGILEQANADPLAVRVSERYRVRDLAYLDNIKAQKQHRRDVAQQHGTVIHNYEQDFVTLLESHPGKPIHKIDFAVPMERLIKNTAAKMKGFDVQESQEYYRRVITRAMDQAAKLGEVQQREEYLDKYLPWVMMNDNPSPVLVHPGYTYWPRWVRRSAPMAGGGGLARSAPARSGPSRGGRVRMGDVAGSFAGWSEKTMGSLAGALMPGALSLPNARGGFVDLSGVDRVTGDVFQALASSSGSSSGGGGGGSSCACAGCACACACAGGGR